MFSLIVKLLGALNSDTRPSQIAMSFVFAMIIGFNGFTSPLGLLVIVLLFAIRCNLSIFLAMSAVFGLLSLLLSPITQIVGEMLLTQASLVSLWTELYQTYWFRLASLNNTLVMGDLVVSIIMVIPMYFIAYRLVIKYRQSFMEYVNKFKVVQTLKASKFYRMYMATQG